MATLKDAEQLAQQLEELAAQLRSELQNGDVDFNQMVQIADNLGESADALASTFAAMDEALMERLRGVSGGDEKDDGGSRRGRRRRQSSTDSLSKEDLLERARKADIPGRSEMSKDELKEALRSA